MRIKQIKPIFIILLAIILQFPHEYVSAQDNEEKSENILSGKIYLQDIKAPPYQEWFLENYKDYEVDSYLAEVLKDAQCDKIIIVLGTWCGDSRREVPRFYRILSEMGWSADIVEMYAVDRSKTTDELKELRLTVDKVPTFFFYNADILVGTIIESPINSLEDDMMQILLP